MGISGGLLTAHLSPQCCYSTQVVMQRGLHAYGLAQPCKAAWKCSADGITPAEDFEEQARQSMCSEQSCMQRVVAAMRSNWMTAKGADSVSSLCDNAAVTVEGE